MKVVKGKVIDKIILKEGEPGLNFNGGKYDEILFILQGENGKVYESYWSSSDFDYCPLYGCYTDCHNCNWWWSWWLPCNVEGECPSENLTCDKCREEIFPCQNPDLVIVETPKGIFWAKERK